MNKLLAIVRRFTTRAEAATMIEYSIMLVLVAAVCISVVAYIGSVLVRPMYQITGF